MKISGTLPGTRLTFVVSRLGTKQSMESRLANWSRTLSLEFTFKTNPTLKQLNFLKHWGRLGPYRNIQNSDRLRIIEVICAAKMKCSVQHKICVKNMCTRRETCSACFVFLATRFKISKKDMLWDTLNILELFCESFLQKLIAHESHEAMAAWVWTACRVLRSYDSIKKRLDVTCLVWEMELQVVVVCISFGVSFLCLWRGAIWVGPFPVFFDIQ